MVRRHLLVTLLSALALAAPRTAVGQQTSADLQVTKFDTPDPVPPGGTITYDIVVTNAGPDTSEFLSLEDTLPAGTTFLALGPDPSWTCSTPTVGSGGTVSCSVDSLAADSSAGFSLTVQVDSGLTPGTVITNTATASSETPDPNVENNDGIAETTVATPPPGADLSVAKLDDPDPVAPGADLVYTVTVTNAGPDDATSVNLVDALPGGTTFVSLSSPGGWSCAIPAVGDPGDVLCSIASLGVGDAVFTLTVAVDSSFAPGSQIFNSATVSASSDDPDEGNNAGTATTDVQAAATLSGTKSVSGDFTPGGAVTYNVVITNSGPFGQGDNAGDEFTDVLPASLTLVGATATSGTATSILATNTVAWNGALAVGESVTITIDATIGPATAGTTISNQGTIRFDADGNGTNEASAPSDDPSAPGAADPTVFQVAGAAATEVPVLSPYGFVALTALLAAFALATLRRAYR